MARIRSKRGDSGNAKTSQLDLFASPILTAAPRPSEALPTLRQPSRHISARSSTEALVNFVLGAERKRGRPEKLLPVSAAVASDRRLLDVREAAARLGLSKSTLDKMRCSGRGPRFIRATDRAVRYDPVDLDAFADERRRRSTSDDAAAALGA